MPTCRYHEASTYVCEAQATHRLSFDTTTGRPLGYILGAEKPTAEGWLPEAVFCLTHAGDVSQAVWQRWQAAQAKPCAGR